MNVISKKLLQNLFKSSEGLYVFTIYQRLSISPKDLFVEIKDLVEKEIIKEEADRIILTNKGREFIINNNISTISSGNKFDKIPQEFIGKKIKINEFYLPISRNIKLDLLL